MTAVLLLGLLVACGDATATDAGGHDDAQISDAATTDARSDAAIVEDGGELDAPMPIDAGSRPDAGTDAGCAMECSLYILDPDACDSPLTCRLRGCSTYCGMVFPMPGHHGDLCTSSAGCDRAFQCLAPPTSGSGACFRYCRIGTDDCERAGGGVPSSSSCTHRTDLRDIDDDMPVVLPADIGVCD